MQPQGGSGAQWSGALPVTGLERRSIPPKHFSMGLKGETTSWGKGSLSVLIPSLPLPSARFRCIPSTDGGSEARCQQGSEQPFPGAPTFLAPPFNSSLPVSGSSSPFLCTPALARLYGTKEREYGGSLYFLCLWELLLLIW